MALVQILRRRVNYQDQWSNDDGETWITAPLRRAAFQYYIEKDFDDEDNDTDLWLIGFRWHYDDGEE